MIRNLCYKRHFVLLQILLFSAGFAQKKPDWILNPPSSPDYFTGVNFAGKNVQDYIGSAKSKALKDLASQIVVNVNSESVLQTSEIDNTVKQSFVESIRTSVQRELEGYELVETWQDKNEYWVYIRLRKSDYYAARRAKFRSALEQSETLYANAGRSESSGNLYEALGLYIKSTVPLEPFLTEDFDAELKSRSTLVMNGAMNSAFSILANSRVIPVQKQIRIKPGGSLHQDMDCRVVFTKDGKEIPVSNFPLSFQAEQGKLGLSADKMRSNSEGLCKIVLSSCYSDNGKAKLKVSVDLEDLLKEQDATALICQSLKKKTAHSDFFLIELANPTICFESDEKNLGKKLAVQMLEPAMKDLLKEWGYNFVPNPSAADFVVTIKSDTRQGGKAYDLAVSYLDATIAVRRTESGEQIYSKQFAAVKGVKQDHLSAGSEAYRKMVTGSLKAEFASELKEKLSQ